MNSCIKYVIFIVRGDYLQLENFENIDNIFYLVKMLLIIYVAVGVVSGFILLVDKLFMIRRYPILAPSAMYNLLLKDDTKKIKISTISRGKARKILISKYDIKNKKEAKAYLQSYFEQNKVKDYSKILFYINKNEFFDEKSEQVLSRFNEMKEIATGNYMFLEDDFNDITNVSAYQYANVGYIVKLSLRSKFINEKLAIKYLRKIKTYVDEEYADWLEYAVSFLTGNCIKSTLVDEELIYILDYLTFNNKSIWAKVPLHEQEEDFFTKFEY